MKFGQKHNYEDGQTIISVTGKLVKLFNPETKNGAKGPFTIQKGILNVDGDDVKIANFGDVIPQSLWNKNVTFKSSNGQKGIAGVRYRINRYTNNNGEEVVEEVIQIGKSGKVISEGYSPTEQKVPPSSGDSPRSDSAPIYGATVGAAINKAVDILMATGKGYDYYFGKTFPLDVHAIASTLVRVHQKLEKGEFLDIPNQTESNAPTEEQPVDENW